MNDDEKLENELRMLKPGPLPEDLKARLAEEPSLAEKPPPGRTIPWMLLVAAAAACLVAFVAILVNPTPSNSGDLVDSSLPPLSILQKDSMLVSSRPLALREHEGQVWEVSEEEWRDDTVALCSATPVQVRSTENRKKIVYRPVEFQ
jgi:hypothetical protein